MVAASAMLRVFPAARNTTEHTTYISVYIYRGTQKNTMVIEIDTDALEHAYYIAR